MVLVQKRPFLQRFFFRQYRPGKCLLLSRLKSGKINNFPKVLTQGVGPKIAIFPTFLYGIKARKMSYDILQRKNAFLGYKNKKFKKSKN